MSIKNAMVTLPLSELDELRKKAEHEKEANRLAGRVMKLESIICNHCQINDEQCEKCNDSFDKWRPKEGEVDVR